MKFSPYSYSRIAVYQQCPRKFKYSYIDKIKVPFVYNEALVKGGAVHSVLEHFPNQSDHKHAKKYFHVAEEFLKSPIGWELINKPAAKELDIALNKSLEPCGYKDKDALFRGSVDRIVVDSDMFWLIDWKTGKLREQRYQSYDQLMFYAIWVFIKYPQINKVKISYYYVEHLESNDLILERQYFENYKKNLLNNITDIEKDNEFNKNITKLCDYCDYQEHCSKDI